MTKQQDDRLEFDVDFESGSVDRVVRPGLKRSLAAGSAALRRRVPFGQL